MSALLLVASGAAQSDRQAGLAPGTPTRLHAAAGWGMPAVDEDTIYYLSKRHELFAVDRDDGTQRWRVDVNAAGPVTRGTRVVVAGGVVVAGDGDLVGIDRDLASPRWRFSPSGGDGVGEYLGDVVGSVVVTGSSSGRVYAVDAASGAVRWTSRPLASRSTVFPPVATPHGIAAGYTDFSVVPRGGGVVLIDAATGEVRWKAMFTRRDAGSPAGFAGGPIAIGDVVLAAASDGTVHAFDHSTGGERWTLPPIPVIDPPVFEHVSEAPEDFRAMVAAGRTAIIGSTTGVLTAVDVDRRLERWRVAAPQSESIGFWLRADDRAVYVTYVSGRLTARSLVDGRELWRTAGHALPLFWPPTLAGHALYATTREGLYEIRQ